MSTVANTNPEVKEKNTKYYILSIIGITIMFGFGFLPTIGPVTEMGMRVLGVFLGIIFLWSTVELLWPSILALAAFAFIGYAKAPAILAMSLGNETVWICAFAMAILGVIDRAGVNDHIITFLLTRKICNGRPWVFCIMWFVACAFFSVFTNPMVATLMLWSILVSLCRRVGYKRGDVWPHLMVLGTSAICGFACNLFPFKGMPLWLFGSVKASTGLTVDYFGYIDLALCIVILMVVALLLLMKFVFKVDVAPLKAIDAEFFKKELPPMTKKQKFLLGFFFFYIAALAIPSLFPQGSWVASKYGLLGSAGIIMFLVALLSLIKLDGQPAMKFQDLASNYVMWNIVFLLSVALSLSNILLDESTGIKAGLLMVLTPIFSGLSPIAFMGVLLFIAVALSNVFNNMVVALILTPIIVTFSTIFPVNVLGSVALICMAVNVAFILPSASPASAMIFGHEYVVVEKHWKITIISCITWLLVLVLIGYPLSHVFLPMT